MRSLFSCQHRDIQNADKILGSSVLCVLCGNQQALQQWGVREEVPGERGRCDLAQAFGFSLFSNCQSTSSSLFPPHRGQVGKGKRRYSFEQRIWKKVENIRRSPNVNRTWLCREPGAGVPELPLGRVSWPQMAPAMSLVFATPPREAGSVSLPLEPTKDFMTASTNGRWQK